MKNNVIVIPSDGIIMVDGEVFFLDSIKSEIFHAIQWHNGEGHIEQSNGMPNLPLTVDDYNTKVAPFVALWEEEKNRLKQAAEAAEIEYNKIENVKARKLDSIDAETSKAIVAGFTCEATPPDTNTPELLHFSYDEQDQQNFADAAVSMQLALASGGAIPTTTPWNAYRNHTDDYKGDLIILNLTAETFVPIYAAALTHKATQMAIGGQRKAAVYAAQTKEEIEAI